MPTPWEWAKAACGLVVHVSLPLIAVWLILVGVPEYVARACLRDIAVCQSVAGVKP